MQPGAEAMQRVAQFDTGFERWKATSQKVLELASSDPQAASALWAQAAKAKGLKDPSGTLAEFRSEIAKLQKQK